LFRRPLGRLVAVGTTGDAMFPNSSFVDLTLTVSEGNHRASWFATARQWPGPRARHRRHFLVFVDSGVFRFHRTIAFARAGT